MGEQPTDLTAPGNRRRPGDGEKWKVNRAVRASTLPAPSRLIMLVLSDIADSGTAELPPGRNPSTAQLARETGHSLSTVKTHRAALQKAGWIAFTPPTLEQRARHEPGTYKLRVPEGQQRAVDAQGRRSAPGPRRVERGSALDPRDGQLLDLEASSVGQLSTHATVSSQPSRGSAPDPLSTYDQNNDQKNRAAAVRESIERVCTHLADRIEANGTPRPPVTGAWRDAAGTLLYRDGHDEDSVQRAIDFAHDDTFWRIHITSPAKLREKWHEIRLSLERARQREQTHAARGGAVPLPPPVPPPNGPVRPAPPELTADARRRIADARTTLHAAEARNTRPSPEQHHTDGGER